MALIDQSVPHLNPLSTTPTPMTPFPDQPRWHLQHLNPLLQKPSLLHPSTSFTLIILMASTRMVFHTSQPTLLTDGLGLIEVRDFTASKGVMLWTDSIPRPISFLPSIPLYFCSCFQHILVSSIDSISRLLSQAYLFMTSSLTCFISLFIHSQTGI